MGLEVLRASKGSEKGWPSIAFPHALSPNRNICTKCEQFSQKLLLSFTLLRATLSQWRTKNKS